MLVTEIGIACLQLLGFPDEYNPISNEREERGGEERRGEGETREMLL